MSSLPNEVEEAPEDLLEAFYTPTDIKDQDQLADRLFFILHFWPAEFPVHGRALGFDTWHPGYIHPVRSQWYLNRHHNNMSREHAAVVSGIETTKNLAGRAVQCLMETYAASFGAVSLEPLTDEGYTWEDAKAWWRRILPKPFDFEQYDLYQHRDKALVELVPSMSTDAEAGALKLVRDSNTAARKALRKWAVNRITEAKKAEGSGLGMINLDDREIDWFIMAGIKIPKTMATYTSRTDIRVAEEDEPVTSEFDTDMEPAGELKESVTVLAQTMQQMMALQMEQLQQVRAPGPDPEVESLRKELNEIKTLLSGKK